MATYRQRGYRRWEVQVRRRGWPTQTRTFGTKGEGAAWAAMIESEMKRGVWMDRSEAQNTTLRDALDRYEAEVMPGLKGYVREKSVLGLWRDTALAKRALATIRGGDIAAQRDEWLSAGLAPSTVLRRLARLSHLFNTARREWGMEGLANPVELVRKPAANDARTRRVVGDELERIAAASASRKLPAVLVIAVETAMRRGEIAALSWEYVDLVRRVAHLPETKNGNSRDVPLSSAAVAALSALPRAGSGGSVFGVHPDGLTQAFERARARALANYKGECSEARREPEKGFLVDLRFHDLRHESISRLAAKFSMHELCKISGHRDPRMLLRYYQPDPEELAARLD